MSNYKLYTDRPVNFNAGLEISGASTKNSIVRIILETSDLSLIFNGSITNNTCNVPIKKLKNILDENTTGKLKLEVIVEDTVFYPYSTDFIVDTSKKVNVKISENNEIIKPTVKIKNVDKQIVTKKAEIIENKIDNKLLKPIQMLYNKLKNDNVKYSDIKNNFYIFESIFDKFFIDNKQYSNNKNKIITETLRILKD